MMEGYTMQNPTIKQVVTSINFGDIARYFSLKEMPEDVEKRLNIWAHKARVKYGYDDHILNTAILLGLRTKKDKDIPNNRYLNSILENFKKFRVETIDDAVEQFTARINFELEKMKTAKEVKKHFQNKNITKNLKRI